MEPRAERAAAAETEPPVEENLQERVKSLEAEKEALTDRFLRLAAEFDNRRKREQQVETEAERRGRERVLLDLLEVADDFERALASVSNGELTPVREGVALVSRNLQQRMERHGVKEIEAEGKRFDPRFHEAIDRSPTNRVPPGTVLRVAKKGYLAGDRLLRPASVVVAAAPSGPSNS